MAEQLFTQSQQIVIITLADESAGRNEGDAVFPHRSIIGKLVEDSSVFVQQPLSQNYVSAGIDQVPIVEGIYFIHEQINPLFFLPQAPVAAKFPVEDKNAAEALLVQGRAQQLADVIGAGGSSIRIGDPALLGHTNAEKLVAFGIPPGKSLKVASLARDVGGDGSLAEIGLDVGEEGHAVVS